MASKRKKIIIDEKTRTTLVLYWDRGLTGYGDQRKRDLLQEAVLATGLEEVQVKDWIGNYRKKMSGKQYCRHDLVKTKTPSGYNLFVSEYFTQVSDLQTLCQAVGVEDQSAMNYEEYLVEAIEGRRKRLNKTQYLVKWVGYPERTWEPCKNIPIDLRKAYNQ